MRIETAVLQETVTKAVKGTGFNKILPLTCMMRLWVDTNRMSSFSITTYDGTNQLTVCSLAQVDAINVVVDADMFSKLVGKLTAKTTELEVVDRSLVIKSGGTYKLALPVDDRGEVIDFPMRDESGVTEVGNLTPLLLNKVLSVVKPSLSTESGTCYFNYLLSDKVLASDRAMMSVITDATINVPKMLVNREFIDLLSLSNDTVRLSYNADTGVIVAESTNIKVVSSVAPNMEDFNEAGVQKMLDLNYDSMCRVSRSAMLSALDRLALFVDDQFDNNAIKIKFCDGYIKLTSLKSNASEDVEYLESVNHKDSEVYIDISRLIKQLKGYQSDTVDVYYGGTVCIKLMDGDSSIQVIALMRM